MSSLFVSFSFKSCYIYVFIYNFTQCQGTKEQFKTESHFFYLPNNTKQIFVFFKRITASLRMCLFGNLSGEIKCLVRMLLNGQQVFVHSKTYLLANFLIQTLTQMDILCHVIQFQNFNFIVMNIYGYNLKTENDVLDKLEEKIVHWCDRCPEHSLPSPWKPTRITCTSSSRAGRAHLRLITAGLDKPPQHTRW